MSFRPDPAPAASGQTSFSPNAPQQSGGGGFQSSFAPDNGSSKSCGSGGMSFSPNGPQHGGSGMQNSFAPMGMSGGMSFSPDGPQQHDQQQQQQQQQQQSTVGTSFAPSYPNTPASSSAMTSFTPSNMGMTGGFGGMMGGMMGGGMDMMGMGMMGGMGASDAMFRQALAMGGGGSQTQLHLLLPQDMIQRALIPNGHLADIAARCQIRIDLGADMPPNLRQVTLHGSVAANSMAAYFLQQTCLQLSSGMGGHGK